VVLYSWAVLLAVTVPAVGQNIPVPRTHVADHAGIIDSRTEAQLDAILTELERKTTAQIVVLTVKNTGGLPVEQFALSLAEKWQLGQKGKDNGLLIVVSVGDRKYRFEVGYGLEGVTPDAYCGTVGRRYFVPYFKQGQFGKGIYQGTLVIAQKIAQSHNVTIAGLPTRAIPAPRRLQRRQAGCCSSIFPLLIFMWVFGSMRGRRRGMMFWGMPFLFGAMAGGRGSSGGFGGGGFGSFGGGGGGSFGGGGASCGW